MLLIVLVIDLYQGENALQECTKYVDIVNLARCAAAKNYS